MDWNFDGHLDILSGCYWTSDQDGGHLQILAGKGDMDFAQAESVTNVAGEPLQNVEVDKKNDQSQTLAICTEQHAVDYDGDGDLDIVMGCFLSNLYLYENVSEDAGKIEISEEVKEIQIPGKVPGFYHSAPHLVDWDSDGDLDLLTGSSTGGALISENVGSKQEPQWSEFKQLIDPSSLHEQFADEEIKMGPSTRIWATDFNKDGLLDLLVGDSTSIISPKDGLTRDELKEKRAANQKEMMEVSKRRQEFMPEYLKLMENGEEIPDELEEKMQECSSEFQKIYEAQEVYQQLQRTGHVWVLIQKPSTQTAKAPKGTSVSKLDR